MNFKQLYLTNPKFHAWYYRVINSMPTEKILILQGPKGSGKTTTAREMLDDLPLHGLKRS